MSRSKVKGQRSKVNLISAEAQRNCFCSLSPNDFIVGGEGWGEGKRHVLS
jgi:hypothetical protein